ncbi:ATP-dependent helicase [Rhodopirellula sp. JC740]|uniref:DNA 3'-5' helicase n=1 Tax=Rhodopirellula halodulae TaxID=2894198 RepID=A0ABS8NNM7_9BACT|nr:ATP-dependent helicase [Rhodopirellula sp. JC740]MCC9645199.1 ATP-dependent helicase [Rhodopirellula sp. JC740]
MGRKATQFHLIDPQTWCPVGIDGLEDSADEAARCEQNSIVVAGPGAGKTELLAQRADYLLRTGQCATPQRILAISLKCDAAKNLRERVCERLPNGLADRFDSMTCDAFSKQLVDRFRLAVPEFWRPEDDYRIEFNINESKAGNMISNAAEILGCSPAEQAGISRIAWYRKVFCQRLPEDGTAVLDSDAVQQRMAATQWQHYLRGKYRYLNFHMIARLAELVLRTNPRLLRALQMTYSHVFLDEFQDMTNLHYDLLVTAFRDSDTVLTAVGDTKQCIMTWAGALAGITERYAKEFGARPFILRANYRSEPELIRIIGSLAQQIEPDAIPPIPGNGKEVGEGQCRVIEFSDDVEEAAALAKLLHHTVEEEEIDPRDICVLCRKKVEAYSSALVLAMRQQTTDIQVRDETKLQDLLAEPIVQTIVDALDLATSGSPKPDAWERLQNTLTQTSRSFSSRQRRLRNDLLSATIDCLRSSLTRCDPSLEAIHTEIVRVLEAFGENALRNSFAQYRQGIFFDETVTKLSKELAKRYGTEETQTLNWQEVIADFTGVSSIPVMTIHKSKGLEYHTVVFMGLEDSAFNNLSDPSGDGNAFFVAMSRAKKRIIFTFAESRFRRAQSKKKVSLLYGWLEEAGVHVEKGSDLNFDESVW